MQMNKNDVFALFEWLLDKTIYEYWGKGQSKVEKNPIRNIP